MRQRIFTLIGILLLTLTIPARISFGWHATGHIVVALIAWEDMTPKTRAAVTALLKQHARYEKDLLAGLPDGATQDETDRYAFATAATWPDLVRSPENPMHATHNHPSWHYIDLPWFHGMAEVAPQPDDGPGPHNVVEALQQCTGELNSSSVSPAERAVDICWIEHLVGDIHQPLHAISLYSPQFPDGDKGGNDEMVLKEPPYPNTRDNLHSVWDGLPGEFHSQEIDGFEAAGLRADPKFSREHFKPLLDHKDFMDWARESHDLAVQYAYLNGSLQSATVERGSHGNNGGTGGNPIPGLPPGYLAKAEEIAMQRVVLAGYRLADVLNAAFDPHQ